MRLKNLSDDERLELADMRARGFSISKLHTAFYEKYSYVPEEDRYGYQTVLAYFNSQQGKDEVQQAKNKIRASASEAPYTHRGERISVLNESLDNLLDRIRTSGLDDRVTVLLSGEIRQVIREIREEASVYDDAAQGSLSPVESFFKKLSALDPQTRQLIEAATEGDAN